MVELFRFVRTYFQPVFEFPMLFHLTHWIQLFGNEMMRKNVRQSLPEHLVGARVHYVMVSKVQWKPFCHPGLSREWLAGLLQCIQLFFSQTWFDFQRSVSHSTSPKFLGKTPYFLRKPRICFLGPKKKQFFWTSLSRWWKRTQKSEFRP